MCVSWRFAVLLSGSCTHVQRTALPSRRCVMAADKVIVTNVSALRAKYGEKFARVKAAIDAMIAADAGRDLVTRLIAIDSQTDMARVGAKAVTSAVDQAGAKAAVDAIY